LRAGPIRAVVPPFTYYEGLYQRATGKFDCAALGRRKDKLDGKTVFDISSDTLSAAIRLPLINANGEVIAPS
jgi:hypothetical protein